MAQLLFRAGDILLYHKAPFRWSHPFGWLFGSIIGMKTWHDITHVEIYDGQKMSWASRDGQGFDHYPVRISELAYVLRPQVPLDLEQGRVWARTMIGTPYGWVDLLAFTGADIDKRGIVCSPAAAGYLRACGWGVFATDPINKISPFQFLDLVEPRVCTVAYDFTKSHEEESSTAA